MNESRTIEPHVGQASCLPVNAASSRVFPTIQKSIYPFIQPSELSPRSRLMGGQFAETLSKAHIFHTSLTPMAFARPVFSVIRRIFGEKTVSKTHFLDHRKGQFPLFHGDLVLNSISSKTAKNEMLPIKPSSKTRSHIPSPRNEIPLRFLRQPSSKSADLPTKRLFPASSLSSFLRFPHIGTKWKRGCFYQ